jgi:hypothetical protein
VLQYYAHRLLPSAFVVEVELLGTSDSAPAPAAADAASADAPAPLAVVCLSNDPGLPSPDINFTEIAAPTGAP